MPRPTVTERLRATLKPLLRKHGTAAALAEFSAKRPGGRKILAQELSYFLQNTPGRRGLQMDDLDDIADFLRKPIGELFGPTKVGEFSGTELRLLYAFRSLPEEYAEHFLMILEAASVAVHAERRRRQTKPDLPASGSHGHNLGLSSSGGSPHGRPLPADSALDELADDLAATSLSLGALATRLKSRRSARSAASDESSGR